MHPGDVVGRGRFEIRKRIGEGGMGVVYEALDRERGARVALKTLSRMDATATGRLKTEFRGVSEVVHWNLARQHELFADGDLWFFTMELVEGVPFLEYVREDPAIGFDETIALRTPDSGTTETVRTPAGASPHANTGRFRERTLRNALRQLVTGVGAIHASGKLHRDLKPSNVLVQRHGRVVILDFGLVADQVRNNEEGVDDAAWGTPAYMAPEQARGELSTIASDFYAVGVMLYEALTGSLPFGGTASQVLRAKQDGDPRRPSEFVGHIPRDLDDLCMDLLQREPERRPRASQIVARLGAGHVSLPGEGVVELQERFVARDRELAILERTHRTVLAGKVGVAFVCGPSGVGKTTTINRFVATLGDAVVLRSRCYERESVPFKAFDGIVDEMAKLLRRAPRAEVDALLPPGIEALTQVFPVLRRLPGVDVAPPERLGDANATRRRAFTAFKELCRRLAARWPVVFVIDDLQWADADSAALLQELIGPPDPPPLLLLGSYRSNQEHTPFLKAVLVKGALERPFVTIPIEPLAPDETRRLAEGLLADAGLDVGAAERLAAESDGSPFFLGQLVRFTRAAGPGAHRAPISLARIVEDTVAALPEDSRSLLEATAIAGRSIPQALAFEVAGVPMDRRASLDELRSSSLVRTTGPGVSDGVETFHDRVREAVVAAMDRQRYVAGHRRMANALERSGTAEARSLVEHFREGGMNEEAGKYAVLAGDQAALGLAFLQAADHYRTAISLSKLDQETERTLSRKLGNALAAGGQGGEAARAYLRAAEGLDQAAADELMRLAGEQYLREGRATEGVRLFRGVLQRAGLGYPETEGAAIAGFLLARGRIRLRGLGYRLREEQEVPDKLMHRVRTLRGVYPIGWADPIRGALFMSQYLLAALDAGVPDHVMHVIVGEGVYASMFGGVDAERKVAALRPRVYELAEQVGTPESAMRRRFFDAMTSFLLGHWKQVLQPTREASEMVAPGNALEVGELKLRSCQALLNMGRVADLTRELPSLAREAEELGHQSLRDALGPFMVYPRLAGDDVEGAKRAIAHASGMWSRRFGVNHLQLMVVTPLISLYLGDAKRAREELRRREEEFKRSGLERFQATRVPVTALRAAVELEAAEGEVERKRAERQARRAVSQLEKEGMLWVDPHSDSLRAALAWSTGNRSDTAAALTRAAERFERAGMELLAHAHRRKWGELTGGDAGGAAIGEADAFMQQQGIRDPEKWARMQAPGLPISSP